MRTEVLVILVIAALVLSGCITPSSEIVTPKTRIAQPSTASVGDCFFVVNESAHSATTGASQQITVNGYVSTICSYPFENLAVRGTFTDRDGHALGSADDYVGHVGYHETVPFSLTIETDYTDLYTYRLEPVITGQKKFF
jgi:hypothetical protein